MANAVAEVELDNGRSAEIYIAADYEYENSLITVIERDEDGCQDRAYDSESTQEWPLLDSFFGSREKVQIPRYLNAYYYYRANGEDAIPYERYTARLNRVISALLVEGYKVEFDYYTTEEGQPIPDRGNPRLNGGGLTL